MINKKIIGIGTVLVILLLILANIPSVMAYTPSAGQGEEHHEGTNWDFYYGQDETYGAYVRDIQWNSVAYSFDRYLGLLSVPWVEINQIRYFLPRGTYNDPPSFQSGLPSITYQYTFDGEGPDEELSFVVRIIITFTHPTAPAEQAQIQFMCDIVQVSPYELVDFMMAIRADFDIEGTSSVNDNVHAFKETGLGDLWVIELQETTVADEPVDTDWYNTKVMQRDSMDEPWDGPNACFAPHVGDEAEESDILYLIQYNSGEYLGHPYNYLNTESLNAVDTVVWDLTYTIEEPTGADFRQSIWLT